MDVKTAFFHGDIEEELYSKQFDGFVIPGKEQTQEQSIWAETSTFRMVQKVSYI